MKRLGIFGGSFSPPHLGHFGAASAFLTELSLDRLLIIPSSIPPHKGMEGITDGENRLALCRLAFGSLPDTEISDMELCRPGKSYTYLTLRELQNPNVLLFLLCGTDMMLTLDSWAHPEEIFRLSHIVTAARIDSPDSRIAVETKKREYEELYGAEITLLHNPVLEVSSTEIRDRISRGEDTADLLNPRVREYITERRLFRDDN